MIALVSRPTSDRMELRVPAVDRPVLALARRAHGTDLWACTRDDVPGRVVWRETDLAALGWLHSIQVQEQEDEQCMTS